MTAHGRDKRTRQMEEAVYADTKVCTSNTHAHVTERGFSLQLFCLQARSTLLRNPTARSLPASLLSDTRKPAVYFPTPDLSISDHSSRPPSLPNSLPLCSQSEKSEGLLPPEESLQLAEAATTPAGHPCLRRKPSSRQLTFRNHRLPARPKAPPGLISECLPPHD